VQKRDKKVKTNCSSQDKAARTSMTKIRANVYLSPTGAAAEAAGDLVRLCGAGNFRSSPRLPPRRLRSRERDLLRRKLRDRDGDILELRDYIFAKKDILQELIRSEDFTKSR
jgi:hypothetical protein